MQTVNDNRTGPFYRPELDSLRFFAFLLVFISHALSTEITFYTNFGVPLEAARWLTKGIACGGHGVALFFLLSSYLITELLIRERSRTGSLDVRSFYIRRALRIWPLYFFFLLVVYVVIPQSSIYALKDNFVIPMLLLVGNWACVFYQGMGHSVAGPLWSISVEEQFYLAWPLVISGVGVKYLKRVCIALIVFANLVRIVMEKKGAGDVAFVCSTFSWMDTIAIGALLALFLRGGAPRLSSKQRVLLGAGGLAVWVVAARFSKIFIYPDIAGYPLTNIGSIMMFLAVLGSSITHPILVYLGRVSYGLYVFHVGALTLASFLFVQFSFFCALTGLAITILFAAISYRCLEEPFLRLKKCFTHVPSRPVRPTLSPEVYPEPPGH